jgi:hypothetical protein
MPGAGPAPQAPMRAPQSHARRSAAFPGRRRERRLRFATIAITRGNGPAFVSRRFLGAIGRLSLRCAESWFLPGWAEERSTSLDLGRSRPAGTPGGRR